MKTGRNDPCPCGSNKKYKKCCLAKDEAARAAQRAADAEAAAAQAAASDGEETPAAPSPAVPGARKGNVSHPRAPLPKSNRLRRRKV